jgi:hypothetical protein
MIERKFHRKVFSSSFRTAFLMGPRSRTLMVNFHVQHHLNGAVIKEYAVNRSQGQLGAKLVWFWQSFILKEVITS